MASVKPFISCAAAAALLALTLTVPSGRADTWTADTGDWFDDANWLDGTVPTADDHVVIDNGGTARVEAPGAAADDLAVGVIGGNTGSLEISNGGTLSSQSSILGDEIDSRGTVTVTGDGSTWVNHGDVVVGDQGVGILTLADGGRADIAGTLTLGNNFYNGAGVLNIGFGGSGAGVLNTSSVHGVGKADLYFHHSDDRYYFTSDGTAAGAGIDITGSIRVRLDGPGTTVLTGNSAYDSTFIDNGTLVIEGGEVFTSGGTVFARGALDHGTLHITGGGVLNNSRSQIARNVHSTAAVIVEGAGSSWINRGELTIGHDGHGTLSILDGGQVSSTTGHIGLSAGLGTQASAEVTVDGAGSTWTNHSHLYVGNYGLGTLTVSNGGMVTSLEGRIGGNDGRDSGVVARGEAVVTGEGSAWLNDESVFVGMGGEGTLTISKGGLVQNQHAMIAWEKAGTGTVTLTGAGSTWINYGNIAVGYAGDGALTITDGGVATNQITQVGARKGSSGVLTIADGGILGGIAGDIGIEADTVGEVRVTGAGTMWRMQQTVMVGNAGKGTLAITDGGLVETPWGGAVGLRAGSVGAVTVDGSASIWQSNGELWVGGDGDGTLTLANGGTLDHGSGMGTLTLAERAGSTGVLNIEGDTGGILNAARVESGAGTSAIVNFNHADTSYFFTTDGTADGNAVTITGATAVHHTGTGTTVLTGHHDYTGSTTIDAGTLKVNGSVASVITVNAGGILGGSGSVGDVTVVGGTIAAGNSPGTLTIDGSLTLDAASVLAFELSGLAGISDLIAVDGDLVLDGNLNITNLGGLQAGDHTLLTYTGSLIDHGLALGTHPAAFDFTIDTASSPGSVILHIVPEPATLTLLAVGALGGLWRPRRRC